MGSELPRHPPEARPLRRSLTMLGVYWPALVFLVVVAHGMHFHQLCDDAYISFRYAHNLAHGDGLVFNPGERVMGYSNLLWVLLLTPFELVGVGAAIGSWLLGMSFTFLTLRRLHRALVDDADSLLAAICSTSLLAACGTFSMWTFGGLEGPLLSYLLLVASTDAQALRAHPSDRGFVLLGGVLGLAALTRPEAVGYGLAVVTVLMVQERTPRVARWAGLTLGPMLTLFGASLLLGRVYYGTWLPNTFYAKQQPLGPEILERGLMLTWSFVRDYNGVWPLIVATWLGVTRGSLTARGWYPAAVLGAFLVFYLRVGGDVLVYHRMWMWILPQLALLAGEAIAEAERDARNLTRRGAVAMTAASCLLMLPLSFWGPRADYQKTDDAFLADLYRIGSYLSQLPPGTLVAANNIGILAYESKQPILDMLGLTEPAIARSSKQGVGIPGHESHNATYVLSRRPHLILIGNPRLFPPERRDEAMLAPFYASDTDLLASPEFAANYRPVLIELEDGMLLPAYQRTEP